MKRMVKYLCMALLVLTAAVATAASTYALPIRVINTLDDTISVSICYYNRATGLWTTEGWWTIEGNTTKNVNVSNVDDRKKIYYYAKTKKGWNDLVDRKTIERQGVQKWVSSDRFKNDTGKKPRSGNNLRLVLFYECRYNELDPYIRIDTQPAG